MTLGMPSATYSPRSVRAGQSSSPDVTLSAIRLVLSGGIYIPPDALELRDAAEEPGVPSAKVSRSSIESPQHADFPLTSRQVDVIVLIAEGKSNKEVIVILITPTTMSGS